MSALLHTDGWAGRAAVPVEVVGRTAKRVRVRLLEDAKLPGRSRDGKVGDEILVPAYAVTEQRP